MPPQPHTHQIYHIFLASPGDMNDERQLVRDFFADYNRNIANRQNLEFKVVDWEHYSNSGMGRPQALITQQTLEKYRDSLVLVIGLLGQRFGTPSGTHESGTKEEFETALQYRLEQGDWPEIKWFFREDWSKQGAPKSPKQLAEASKQWQKVEDFKHRLQNDEPRFLTVDFDNTSAFPAIFKNDIERWLHEPQHPWNKQPAPTSTPTTATPFQESPYLNTWLNLLSHDCARLPLELLDERQGLEQSGRISLPDIFVPLKARAPSKTWEDAKSHDLTAARLMTEASETKPNLLPFSPA